MLKVSRVPEVAMIALARPEQARLAGGPCPVPVLSCHSEGPDKQKAGREIVIAKGCC